MDTIFKTYRAEVKAINEGTGEIDMFISLSTDSVDRDGEIIEPMAFKKTLPKFMKRPVLVASHDYRELTSQIGEWSRLKVSDTGLEGKPKYYINEGNEQADWGFKLASKGMAAFSIGFIPKSWEDGDGEKLPRRTYKEVELLEISQVIVPSNREAIQNIRAKGVHPIIAEICDAVEKEIVTKPEETDEYIRIPVDNGDHEGHRIRTIDISEKEGIKAIYCGTDKVVMTYLFLKSKGWTMAKARAWVKEHEKATLNVEHKISQAEIIDEIDYLTSLIKEHGMGENVKESALEFAQKTIVQLQHELPQERAEIIFHVGKNALGYTAYAHWDMVKGQLVEGIDLRKSGSDIPVKDKELTNQDIIESIKRITEVKKC